MKSQCDVCGRKFNRKYEMTRHKRSSEYNPNICQRDKSGHRKIELKRIGAFKCDECGSAFSRRYNMVAHKRKAHGLIQVVENCKSSADKSEH